MMSHHYLAEDSMRKCWRTYLQCSVGAVNRLFFVFATLEATVALVTVYLHTALQYYEKKPIAH